MFSPHQETLIVDMVRANNTITLREIQQKIIEDHVKKIKNASTMYKC